MSNLKGVSARLKWLCMVIVAAQCIVFAQEWRFTDVTEDAGMHFPPANSTYLSSPWTGAAVADIDNDGWLDLILVSQVPGLNNVFRNKGDGGFENVTEQSNLGFVEDRIKSPLFFDYDGDGHIDLFMDVAGVASLYRNMGDMSFTNMTVSSGLNIPLTMFSAAGGDYDRDGDVDLYLAVNDSNKSESQLWRNNGDGSFTNVANQAGLVSSEDFDFTLEFSPSFADINNDGWPDLLVVSDFNNSQVYINNGDGSFRNATTEVITDEGGMGSAVGDYDNDGDLDWFVSSIWDPDQNPFKPWGVSSGNRLYKNKGDGVFEDATDEAGVRVGYWGWGSLFGDFNNDGYLDLFHTNGFIDPSGPFFLNDPVRFFLGSAEATFTEISESLGLTDTGVGNGVVRFDYDRDGDLDLFIANSIGPPKLYRNDGGNQLPAVTLKLLGAGTNTQAVGARLYLTTPNEMTQMREVICGNNFLSQNPTETHFGLGAATYGDLEIVWPNGARAKLYDVKAGERLVIPQLPLSYDTELAFFEYYAQISKTLKDRVDQGVIDEKLANRLRHSATKALIEHRYAR